MENRINPTFPRILIADDQTIVRKGTRALLDLVDEFDVVGEAANGLEAIALAAALQPDIILMDLVMPELDGIQATERIMAANPNSAIIALTSFGTDDKLLAAIDAGVAGYLQKDADPDLLVEAIHLVARGQMWLTPAVTQRLLSRYRRDTSAASAAESLTERELTTLKLLARGQSNADMAAAMSISEVTVRTHVSRVLAKLNCANRVQATLYALRSGIVSLEEG